MVFYLMLEDALKIKYYTRQRGVVIRAFRLYWGGIRFEYLNPPLLGLKQVLMVTANGEPSDHCDLEQVNFLTPIYGELVFGLRIIIS